LRLPVTWVAIAAYLTMSWIFQGFNDIVPGYIGLPAEQGLGSLGLGMVKGGDFLVLAQLFFMGGSVLGGVITDKVFNGNGRPVMTTGFLMGAIFSYLIMADFVTANEAMLVFCLTACGLFFSFVNPQAVGYIAKNYPKEITGKLGGLATGIAIFGGWGGATVGGILIHVSGYPASIYINVMGFCILGFFVALFLKPRNDFEGGE
jgi:MFS family permease